LTSGPELHNTLETAQAAEKFERPAKIVIASAAKQSRSSIKTTSVWIATSGFALLATAAAGLFSSLQELQSDWERACNRV
jgi:hypothetical protein